jgi:hypothetical protein
MDFNHLYDTDELFKILIFYSINSFHCIYEVNDRNAVAVIFENENRRHVRLIIIYYNGDKTPKMS